MCVSSVNKESPTGPQIRNYSDFSVTLHMLKCEQSVTNFRCKHTAIKSAKLTAIHKGLTNFLGEPGSTSVTSSLNYERDSIFRWSISINMNTESLTVM
jgi:hypothetical protein